MLTCCCTADASSLSELSHHHADQYDSLCDTLGFAKADTASCEVPLYSLSQDVVRSVLHRLRVNMEVAPQLFSIFIRHRDEGESYWLQPGFSVAEQLANYTARKPLDQWR